MISVLKGKILENNGSQVTILTSGGVGYEVMVSARYTQGWTVGTEVQVLTYLAVRENAMELYGFASPEEKDLFTKFLLVSGIGPKTAMHLLSLGSVHEISSAIAREDVGYLTNVSGIGKKTAERIVVELKNKVIGSGTVEEFAEGDILGDVVAGLMALGYGAAEAREAAKKLDGRGKTSEQLMKEALQMVK
ncbi:MAG: Holliday junction branch migration protein RuvA [Patescibacteria group bacterium]